MSELRVIVSVSEQKVSLYEDGRLLRQFVVSTAANGIGCEAGSFKTPHGLFRVAQKFGDGCPSGTVFRSRAQTEQIWSRDPSNPLCDSQEDLVLTRILWLEGLEPHNANTRERYIYFHGTNIEHQLGQAVSHGCIRMSNVDIMDFYERVPEGTWVEIVA